MKVRVGTVIAVVLTVVVVMVWAADQTEPTLSIDQNEPTGSTPQSQSTSSAVDLKKASYAVGVQVGVQVARTIGSLDLDLDAFLNGLGDQLKGKDLALTRGELQQVLLAFSKHQEKVRQAQMVKNGAEAKTFLEANAKRDEVTKTESGLQYEIITKGTGQSPTLEDRVTIHYRGTFVDGTEFDSSYAREQPATIPLNKAVDGWKEGLQMMKEGGKWKLYIPPALGYKDKGSGTGTVPPNKALIFEVELLEVNPASTLPAQLGR